MALNLLVWAFCVISGFSLLGYWCVRYDRILEDQILSVLLRYGEMRSFQIETKVIEDFRRWDVRTTGVYVQLRQLEKQGLIASRYEETIPSKSWCRYYRRTGVRVKVRNRQILSSEEAIA